MTSRLPPVPARGALASQYNDRYISNAGSACTFCIEQGAKNGRYDCTDLVPFEGGASRPDVSGTFRCQ